MKCLINMTTSSYDMDRYKDAEDLRKFYLSRGLDGLELMFTGGNTDIPEKAAQCKIIGIHLGYYPSWVDLWLGNTEGLIEEYGSEEEYVKYYGGRDKNAIIARFRRELDRAEQIGAEYVVFHVAEVRLCESFSYTCRYSDKEVTDAAAELINILLDGQKYNFWFLAENLWWNGLNLKNPDITKNFLKKIHYNKKGIMLDTGHLIHTNRNIKNQNEAVEYINSVLDNHGDLCGYIKGVHLHQTISGEYVNQILENIP